MLSLLFLPYDRSSVPPPAMAAYQTFLPVERFDQGAPYFSHACAGCGKWGIAKAGCFRDERGHVAQVQALHRDDVMRPAVYCAACWAAFLEGLGEPVPEFLRTAEPSSVFTKEETRRRRRCCCAGVTQQG